MQMYRQVLIFASFLCIVLPVFSLPLDELVSPAHITKLRSEGNIIMETQLRNPSPLLLPKDDNFRQVVNRAMNTLGPNMLVEALYLYEKPAVSCVWTIEQRNELFNQLVSLSTMTGIQYFSASRNAMRTFFESSRVIEGPNSKNVLPDPAYPVPPQTLTLHARQKDLSFGDNVYRYDYVTALDHIYFTQDNVTSLSYGIIPVIGRGNLRSIAIIYDCGDSLLVYFASMVKAMNVPGMGEKIGNSFSNRADAILKWFSSRADIVFLTE